MLTVLCRELGCRAVGETCVAVLWRGQLRCRPLFQIYHDTMHTEHCVHCTTTVPLYHCTTVPLTRFQSIYIPEPVERALREWLGEVPVCLRQDVLGRSYGLLFSTIGRVTEMCSSTVPIMLASVMEAVYSPALASVDIWTDFHWHQEARLKVRALNVIYRFLSSRLLCKYREILRISLT